MKEKIMIVCGAGYVSGKEIMALELGIGLKVAGYDICFVTSKWHDGDFKGRLDRAHLPRRKLPIGFISVTLSLDAIRMTSVQMLNWPYLIFGYWRMLRTAKPIRIIHTNWHHLILLMPFLRPRRDIYWVHELVPERNHYKRLFCFLSKRLDRFICVSHAVSASLQRIGVAESKIVVIHNGVSISTIDSSLAEIDAASSHCRIGIIGQIGAWKGHDDLLDALSLVRRHKGNVELHVIGKGGQKYVSALKKRSTELGLSDAVVWRGFVDDRNAIYGGLDICVVPSRFEEPFGLAAVEPGMFGIPVVASQIGGLPEIIEDGVNGLLFPAGNPQELANALIRLIDNPQLRGRMGSAARSIVLKRFASEKFVEKFSLLLRSYTPEIR